MTVYRPCDIESRTVFPDISLRDARVSRVKAEAVKMLLAGRRAKMFDLRRLGSLSLEIAIFNTNGSRLDLEGYLNGFPLS